jgi:Nucleotidyl transferase AbiEii toxin, Type IV TA system
MTANRAASIRARLKQHTDTSKQDFNLTLTRYGLERLLYRLSISEHAPNFLLKARCHSNSGVASRTGRHATPIRKDAGYGGVRIDLRATLDGARLSLQIDIGFGDAVTPAAQSIDYPTLLPDVPAPTLRAYPKATVVAEKRHAVTVLGMTNPRMKDFFDLALLLRDDTLDDAELQQAVEATFARRQTAMPSAMPIGPSNAFADDTTKQTQWRAFLNKNKRQPMDLRDVIGAIRARATQFGFPRP